MWPIFRPNYLVIVVLFDNSGPFKAHSWPIYMAKLARIFGPSCSAYFVAIFWLIVVKGSSPTTVANCLRLLPISTIFPATNSGHRFQLITTISGYHL
jgi:hypothetical protein